MTQRSSIVHVIREIAWQANTVLQEWQGAHTHFNHLSGENCLHCILVTTLHSSDGATLPVDGEVLQCNVQYRFIQPVVW